MKSTVSWRLLKFETHSAFMNMAIDEAVLRSRMANLASNTVRFYQWSPSAVSIGKFQNPANEVYLDNCRAHGVDVVRRITGGGTVYHDERGEITYSVVANKKDMDANDIGAVYTKIYSGIADALRILGVKAEFSAGDAKTCPNLTVHGMKVSGSSQSHKGDFVLQHGTLLVDVNLERMFTFLRVPWAKTCMEVVGVAKNRITSLNKELGREVSTDEVNSALAKGFQSALGVEFVNEELSPRERKLAELLCKEKYATNGWNFNGKSACKG